MEFFMTIERVGIFKFSGNAVTVLGPDVIVGQKAPEFTVFTQNWSSFQGIEDTKGKVRVINSLLSISTDVCDRETRRFNQEAAALDDRIAILTISMDLPYTIKNWCAAAGVDQVKTLSDHVNADFGQKYGVLLKEPRVFRRAVFVVDRNDMVVYSAYMPVLGDEPDYNEVIYAARRALND
jgi:thioredoxin-dependent peroxiredoxin